MLCGYNEYIYIYIYIYTAFQEKIVPTNAYSLEKEFIIVTCNRKR